MERKMHILSLPGPSSSLFLFSISLFSISWLYTYVHILPILINRNQWAKNKPLSLLSVMLYPHPDFEPRPAGSVYMCTMNIHSPIAWCNSKKSSSPQDHHLKPASRLLVPCSLGSIFMLSACVCLSILPSLFSVSTLTWYQPLLLPVCCVNHAKVMFILSMMKSRDDDDDE